MKTKQRILGTLLLGAAIGGAACVVASRGAGRSARAEGSPAGLHRTRAVAVPLRCAPAPDQRIGLTLRSRTATGAGREREPGGAGEITLTGEMDLRVLSTSGEAGGREFTLAGVLAHPELTAAGRRIDDISTALAEPVLFRMDEACRITAFAAPEAMPPKARNQWKSMLKLLEFAVPAPGTARSWTTTQTDGLGTFSATYHGESRPGGGFELQRNRLGYQGLEKQSAGRVGARVVSSRARAEVGPTSGWIRAASVDEHLILELDHRAVADVQTTVQVEAHEVAEATGAFWSRSFDPAAYTFGPPDKIDAEPAPLPYTDRQPIAGLRDRSIDDVVGAAGALMAKKPQPDLDGAAVLLVQYLRLDPKHAGSMPGQLRRGDLAEGTRAVVLLGLQLAGGREAHEALREAARDPLLPAAARRRAVSGISEVPDPDAATVDALLALRRQGDATQAARLGLGVLARNPRLDAAEKRRVLATLADDLAHPGDEEARRVALLAAGNAANPALRDPVAAFTRDPEPTVQAEAYAALAKMSSLPPPAALLDELAKAEAPNLRSTLGDALRGTPLGAAEIERCTVLLSAQPAPDVRAILIDLLGAAAGESVPAKAALRQQLRVEKQGALLTLLGRYLQLEDVL